MKTLIVIMAFAAILLAATCGQPEEDQEETPPKTLAAALIPETGKLIAYPAHVDSLLAVLEAEQITDSTLEAVTYATSKFDSTITFTVDTTRAALSLMNLDILLVPPIFIWANAECSNNHAAVAGVPCIGTFGGHRQFGNFMTWFVFPWTSCDRGKGYCIEFPKVVGSILYYQRAGCSDSTYTSRDIVRFACR